MTGQGTGARSQSLYRKYRPVSFDEQELVGQEHVSRTLRNAVRHERVAHAYLFCGPRGSGKTSSARLLAKAVNCEATDPTQRPCNACAACRAINEGRAVDIIEIDAASNRGIDDIRDLREKVKFAPAQLRVKFYIIDEVHQLTDAASNALLKTLEEPPPHAKFILATTDPEKVLETISSRCQTFIFRRIPLDPMIDHLRRISAREGLRADDAALAAIAHAATGSLRDALGLLDQLAAYGDEGITIETVQQVLGAGRHEQVLAVVDALAAGDVAAGLQAINAVVESGADARQFAGQLVAYLRDLLFALAQSGRALTPALGGVSAAHRTAFALADVATLVKRFSQVDYSLKHSAYGHLPLELCFVECALARAGQATSPSEPPAARVAAPAPAPVERPAALPPAMPAPAVAPVPAPAVPARPAATRPVAAPTPAPEQVAPTAPAPPTTPEVTLEQVAELWPRLRRDLKAVDRRLEALLSSADPWRIADGQLTLVASYEFHRNKLNDEQARATIEAVLARLVGGPLRVSCLSREEAGNAQVTTPATSAPAGPTALQAAPRAPEDDVPPWDDRPPAEHPNGAAVVALPAIAARVERATSTREPAVADERYLNALRNIFNAVEIKNE